MYFAPSLATSKISWKVSKEFKNASAVEVHEREAVGLNHVSRYTCLDQEQQDIPAEPRYGLVWVGELDKGHI